MNTQLATSTTIRQCALCFGEPAYEFRISINLTDGGVEDADRWICQSCAAIVLQAVAHDLA